MAAIYSHDVADLTKGAAPTRPNLFNSAGS